MSAFRSLVSILFIIKFPSAMCLRECWYLTDICFVLGRYLSVLASSLAPSLSSNIVHLIVVFEPGKLNTLDVSINNYLKGIISLAD